MKTMGYKEQINFNEECLEFVLPKLYS